MDFKFSEKDLCVKILGKEFETFYNGDILLVEKTSLQIQMLNKKIILLKNKDNMFIKKVEVRNYIPFLISLNNAYEPIEYSDDFKIVGIITKLLYRDLLEINI